MQSTLIFNDLTCVDHAYINKEGRIVGGSFMLSVILTGEVQEGEEVVIDFSKGKKQLKAAIDDHFAGFDHKLWLCNETHEHTNVFTNDDGKSPAEVEIVTPLVTLLVTPDAVRYVDANYDRLDQLENAFALYLNGVLNADAVKINDKDEIETVGKMRYTTKCKLSPMPVSIGDATFFAFRYAHGLPNSSSYGCQNIAHGHLSYFMLLDENHKPMPYQAFSQGRGMAQHMLDLACHFDDTYFVHRANVTHLPNGNQPEDIKVHYQTERGYFSAHFKGKGNKIVVLDTDTTIEHLIEHMKPSFEMFKEIGAKYLMVSEGLSKGAITEL